jgi:hypothetical protein
MKQVVICLLVFLLSAPPAVAQAQSDEYVPDEPEVPMIDLPPEELPESERVLEADDPDTPFFPYSRAPSRVPTEPQAIPILKFPPPPDIDQGNLPPGYTARWMCMSYEEEVDNGAALFGVKPKKLLQEDGQWKDFYPRVCWQKEEVFTQPQPPTWNGRSKLPPGYVVRSLRCEVDEEEVKDAAALFGLEPIKIRWEDQLVDWLPKICRKKG